MTRTTPLLVALGACALVPVPAAAQDTDAEARARSVSAMAQTPADVFGPLYRAVEQTGIFPDSKTFADMVPR